MRKLSCIKIGEGGVVSRLDLPDATKKRIMDMGLTVGSTVSLVGKAPLGDPLEIKIRDCYLAIRKTDAENILID